LGDSIVDIPVLRGRADRRIAAKIVVADTVHEVDQLWRQSLA